MMQGMIGQLVGGMFKSGGGSSAKPTYSPGGEMGNIGGGSSDGGGMPIVTANTQSIPYKQSEPAKASDFGGSPRGTYGLKNPDMGFYGHMTVAKCSKKVNIIGRGD
jgi:hypothetical protein